MIIPSVFTEPESVVTEGNLMREEWLQMISQKKDKLKLSPFLHNCSAEMSLGFCRCSFFCLFYYLTIVRHVKPCVFPIFAGGLL